MLSASAETVQSRRKWHDTFKVLKGKNLQQRILYLASFRIEEEIKNFPDKQKLETHIYEGKKLTGKGKCISKGSGSAT